MSSNDKKKLTPRQKKALTAVLAGARWNEAALAAGVHERTVHRWREQEAFAFELQRLSTAAVKDAAVRLSGGMFKMLDVLEEIALDEDAPRHVRVRAVLGWIDRQAKVVEVAEIFERIERVEKKVGL
jgi:hypothetical protein